ncbi:MAG: DMT family transporter [Pseudomonadota bacterium]
MSHSQNRPTLGIALTVLAMAFFAVADSLIKVSVSVMAPAHTTLLLMGGGGVVFTCLALVRRERLWSAQAFHPVLLGRYLVEAVAAIGMVSSLAHVPLATLGAVLQASPLVVTAGAVLLFGEQVSWRRWSAIALGFVGVVIILRPGTDGFGWSTLYPVLAMVALSLRDLATRATPAGIPTTSLSAYTMAASLPIVMVWAAWSAPTLLPPTVPWPPVLGMVTLGAVGYLAMTAGVRAAPLSVVTPFRYTRLLFLLILGLVVFDERPDVWTLIGAALIVASGMYAMWRDRVRRLQKHP